MCVIQLLRDLSPDERSDDQHRSPSQTGHRRPVDSGHPLLFPVAVPGHHGAALPHRRSPAHKVHVRARPQQVRRLLHGGPDHLLRRAPADGQRPVRADREDSLFRLGPAAILRQLGSVNGRRDPSDGGGAWNECQVRWCRWNCRQQRKVEEVDVHAPAEQHVDVVGALLQLQTTGISGFLCFQFARVSDAKYSVGMCCRYERYAWRVCIPRDCVWANTTPPPLLLLLLFAVCDCLIDGTKEELVATVELLMNINT